MSGQSGAQRIDATQDLDAENVQSLLLRTATLALIEGIGLSTELVTRLIGMPDDEPVTSVEGAVLLANGSVVAAQVALLQELDARAVRLRLDSAVRTVVRRELEELKVARRDRPHAAELLYQLAALMSGDNTAEQLERVLNDSDPVVQMPLREMVRETGWTSLERWLSLTTFWWVA